MPGRTTTTIKLPPALKTRVATIAKQSGRSPHNLMVDAIARHVDYEERLRSFVSEAVAADRTIERGGEVYRAEDVHAWIDRLARGKRAPRPKPWRR
jgi:predicted transcriptional regulator